MGIFGTGQAIRRSEDQRFLTGTGRYTGDITLDRQAYLFLFRSPFAHGEITQLDVAEAHAADGVIAVYTAAELGSAGLRDLPGAGLPRSSLSEAAAPIQQPPLARDRVRYVGEPVAAVIAESAAQAKDASELIEFDVDELEAVVLPLKALADGAPLIHPVAPGNSMGFLEHGDSDATDKAFQSAQHIAGVRIINTRIAPTAMEPRGCNADFKNGKLTLHQGCQGAHRLRELIEQTFDLEEEDIHVICPDVGGAFGLKFFLQCESVLAIFASMQIGRPVKWIAERTESFLADLHGRDHVSHAELALDGGGRILGLRISIIGNVGAYCSQFGPIIPWFGASMMTGCYDIPVAYGKVQMAMTNTVPVDAYRGAGRPEATYLIERLLDRAAIETGIDRVELRRRNFIAAERFPHKTPTGRVYDSGEYEVLLDKALQRADWSTFAERRAASLAQGKIRGIGLTYYVEICSAGSGESPHIYFARDGRVVVLVGTQASGQGHETSFAQMVSAGLGIPMSNIDIVQGDSEKIPSGLGTGGSRSMVIAGNALYDTVNTVIESGRKMAAEVLEASLADIEFADGQFSIIGTDRVVGLGDVALASFDEERRPEDVNEGLRASESFDGSTGTYPNGCHICEIEVDPDTGTLEILRYTIEDDVGTVVNPLILEGQIVGGVAQGIGQAWGEHAVYDPDSGQLLTATLMDYTMPRADWLPFIDFSYTEVPSPQNPLGIKGAGEAGTIGSTPTLVSAILDALSGHGVEQIDMPLTSEKIWRLIHGQS